ncbi:hypothetical protein BMF94_2726 [Rhodotorula taiwanensis]|uniref:Uncharacterized protein n=1 Tax=Rhodotorula taiwanensis TaxID=741276 RepID=A0A2S5BBZ9_9BASI|nr:hypothetical protein BMF94_2726 [Rhodotorula taiwanensis]
MDIVWSTHKLVCGDRAHPFKLPPFSQEEADYIAQQCVVATETPQAEWLQAELRRLVSPTTSEDRAHYQTCCAEYVGLGDTSITRDEPPKLSPNDANRRHKMRTFVTHELRQRSMALYLNTLKMHKSLDPPLLTSMPYNYDTYTQGAPVDKTSKWHSEFCHRLIAVQCYHLKMRVVTKTRPVIVSELLRTTRDVERSYRLLRTFVQTAPNPALTQAATRMINQTLKSFEEIK